MYRMSTSDFLRDCMTDPALVPKGPIPIDDFTKVYCLRCSVKECSRSVSSNFIFTNRVMNWKRDLFDAPPRATDNDPVFAEIRTKRFIQIPVQIEQIIPEESKKQKSLDIKIIEEQSESIHKPQDITQISSKKLINTKFNQGLMVGNPIESTKEIITLESGGTFSFDSEKNKDE